LNEVAGGANCSRRDGRSVLADGLDTGGFAGELAQVVEFRAANFAPAQDLDLLDARRMEREDALDADAVGNLATVKLARLPPRLILMTRPSKG